MDGKRSPCLTGRWNRYLLGGVRSIGESIGRAGKTSEFIPFIHVMDALTLAISQGSLRRGSAAVYLDIHHPEIEEFLEISQTFGDFNRKSLNLNHGIVITDEFHGSSKSRSAIWSKKPENRRNSTLYISA